MGRSRATSYRHAGRLRGLSVRPRLECLESRQLLANFVVTTTSDTPIMPSVDVPSPLTLRQAITTANANPGPDTISFDLPAKNIPGVVDFDLANGVWRIHVDSALPAITDPVSIDGYSQRFVTSIQNPNLFQEFAIPASTTGGTFTLNFGGQTTAPLPFNATAPQVQGALEALSTVGPGRVNVILGPVNSTGVVVAFLNDSGSSPVHLLTVDTTMLQNAGTVVSSPLKLSITSDQNALQVGFNAKVRVILDGSVAGAMASFPGLTVQTDHSRIRGLNIDGFATGIAVEGSESVGNLIQGNYLGESLIFPVPEISPALPFVAGIGNGVGVLIASPSNNSVGGVSPETHNAVAGNAMQGVEIAAGAIGNQVVGNLIGVLEQTPTLYYQVGNGAEGVLVESASNVIGGAVVGSTNVISDNATYGVHIVGPDAVRNRVEANDIGTDVNGTFLFGQGNPGNGQNDKLTGNLRDGVFIDDAPNNQVGITGANIGPHSSLTPANVISGNFGAGVRISGASATGNVVLGNYIGTNLGGTSALPNFQEGVAISSAGNRVGGLNPGDLNVVSGNRRGVLISGASATGNLVVGNFIGTDGAGPPSGSYDLGNAQEGVRIEDAKGNTIGGTVAAARNLISGNNVGLLIVGATSTGNLVVGNFIGTDVTGTLDLPNSLEGVRIDSAPANTVGGSSVGARNVISANHWGVVLTGATATTDLVQGNFLGTDVTGSLPLGNEVDGVLATSGASNNLIGGAAAGQANTIAFNLRDGVRVETDASLGNAILSNTIVSNGFGIDLVGPSDLPSGVTPNTPGGPHVGPNQLQNHPVLTLASSNVSTSTTITGTLNSTPDTVFLVQFFSSATADPSGFGQGATLLGTTSVTTNAAGDAAIDATFATAVPAGRFLTATATDPQGDTSEFSSSIVVQSLPGTIQFSMPTYVVSEAAGTATITVTRASGSSGTVSVDYATSDATPGAGVDYVSTSGTLVFKDGEIVKTFSITILADAAFEPNQAVRLTLSNPTGGAALGMPGVAILTILDSSAPMPGDFQFSQASYDAGGGVGSATITVTRASGSNGTAAVDFATSNGTGIAGVDYVAESGTLVFNDGETTKQIVIPILDPANLVGNRTINLTLSHPTGGATLGVPSTAVLTIRDAIGPTVQSVRFLIDSGGGVAGLVVTFSEPLNAVTAVNLLNYGYSVRTAGHDHRFGTRDDLIIPIRSAVYDAARQTVTLQLRRGIHPPTPFQLAINQSTNVPGAGVGVADLSGNLLGAVAGSSAGVPFVVILSGKTGGFPATAAATTAHGRSIPMAHRAAKVKAIHASGPRGPLAHGRSHDFGASGMRA